VNKYSNKLEIWKDRVVLVKGIIAKNETEISFQNIKALKIEQTICQRLLKIGNIYIASAGTSDYEERIFGIPNPKRVRHLILGNKE
jgi:uncharacterized membrane protein YdbT with pleckstrin-like domain